jgi:nucleotide-binding universal stress UspA family protein
LSQSLKKILVPLDGSDISEQALGTASSLAQGHGAELHVVSVVPLVPPVTLALAVESRIEDWIEAEQAKVWAYLQRVEDKVSSGSPEVSVTKHVRTGPVSDAVKDLAAELQVDLLVITTHGRGTFERSWLGSTADRLIREVEQPLLVLRQRKEGLWAYDPELIGHVMVPLDGSDAAECALDALPMVLSNDGAARVTLVRVIEEEYPVPPIYIPEEISEDRLREQHHRQAEVYLKKVADRLKPGGFGVVDTRVLVDDHPSRALLRFCDEADIHLVSIATHGRGGVSRFFLGSVADKLIRGAPVPVLVTRRPID